MDFFMRLAKQKMAQQDEDREMANDMKRLSFDAGMRDDADARFARQLAMAQMRKDQGMADADAQADRRQAPTKFLPGGPGMIGGYQLADPHMMSARQRKMFLPNNATADPAQDAQADAIRQRTNDLSLDAFADRSQQRFADAGNEAFSKRPSGVKTVYGFGR
jgi:hypothetical protein